MRKRRELVVIIGQVRQLVGRGVKSVFIQSNFTDRVGINTCVLPVEIESSVEVIATRGYSQGSLHDLDAKLLYGILIALRKL